jgi:hypothetical protein
VPGPPARPAGPGPVARPGEIGLATAARLVLAQRMRIERFDPATDTAALRACHEMFEADWATDCPDFAGPGIAAGQLAWPGTSFRDFAGWWACGFGGDPRETWLATGSTGRLAGCYLLELPDRDNTGAASFMPVTALTARRAGRLGHLGDGRALTWGLDVAAALRPGGQS